MFLHAPASRSTLDADSEVIAVGHLKFSVHATRLIVDEDPIARTITNIAMESARFARPAPRAVREDERLYISGAFTLAELQRIVDWARGPLR
jgi:hypothetical protein